LLSQSKLFVFQLTPLGLLITPKYLSLRSPKMKHIIATVLVSFLALSFPAVSGEVEQVATSVFNKTERELRRLKNDNKLDTQSVHKLVEEIILPHVDAKYFAYKVLGKHLNKLSSEQKSEFVAILQKNLIANYASALRNYNNEEILLTNTTMAPSQKVASLTMKLVSAQKQTSVNTKWRYSTQKESWLMYDLIVEGVSMLQTKQKEIANNIAKQGVDAVILQLNSWIIKV